MTLSPRAAGIIATAYIAVFTAWILLDVGGPVVTRAFDDFAMMAAAAATGGWCLRTSRRANNGTSGAWLLLGLACLSWAGGQGMWAVYQNVLGRSTPFPSFADAGYLAATALMVAAVLVYPCALEPLSRARSALDTCLIAASLFFVSWVTVLGPTWRAGSGPLLAQAIGLAHPTGNLIVCALVMAKLARSPRRDHSAMLLIASGVLVLGFTNTAYLFLSLEGVYQTGSLIDPGWIVAFALIAVAACRPQRASEPAGTGVGARQWMLLLPHVAVAAAVAAAVWVAEVNGLDAFMIGVLVVVAGLSFVRQALLVEESRSAERALAKTAEELADAQAVAHVGSWETDLATGGVHWSEELHRIVGDPEDGRATADLASFVHVDDSAAFDAALRRAVDLQEEINSVVRLVHHSGELRWVHVRGRVAPVGGHDKGRIIGTVQDVTEQQQTNEALRQAQKMEAVGRLAGGISHDFNNLLMSILGYSELALDVLPSGSPARAAVQAVQAAGQHAADLTRQLLTFSRQQSMTPEVIDLNDAVHSAVKLLERLIGDDIRVEMAIEPALPAVVAARAQIEQVVLNLALNARDAMPSGGVLSVETARRHIAAAMADRPSELLPGEYALITVTDTGTGMDARTVARCLDPFFTTKAEGEGTGLGLATVYGIVTQLGGTLLVDSTIGLGSSFSVCLPCHVEPTLGTPSPGVEDRGRRDKVALGS